MTLRKFLSWSYKNSDDKRELAFIKKQALRQRLRDILTLDNSPVFGPAWFSVIRKEFAL